MYTYFGASLVAQTVKNLPMMQEREIWSLNREDPLEKGMATQSSILAWRIPPTEEPSELQSMGLQSWTRLSDYHTLCMFLHPFPLRFITGCWLYLPGLHRRTCCLSILYNHSHLPLPGPGSILPQHPPPGQPPVCCVSVSLWKSSNIETFTIQDTDCAPLPLLKMDKRRDSCW